MLVIVANAMKIKGTLLEKLDRKEEALANWIDVEQRFGTANSAKLLEFFANSFVHRSINSFELNWPNEALATCDRAVELFGQSDEPAILDAVACCLVNKGIYLLKLNRNEEALDVFEDAIRRFGENEDPHVLKSVARAYVNKGLVLRVHGRSKEALSAWRHAAHQFETSDQPSLRNTARLALFHAARFEADSGRAAAAINLLDRALRHDNAAFPEISLQCHLLRASAHFESGDINECDGDIETALTILSDMNTLPADALEALSTIANKMGPESMRDQIKASSAADLLLPLTTALEKDLGLEPRVAKEVDEIAEDILREMKNKAIGDNR